MKYLLLAYLLFIFCEVPVDQAKKYVEAEFGTSEYIYQDLSDGEYFVYWYIVEKDTILKLTIYVI